MWGYNRYTKQEVRIASAFFQNEWKNKQWSFLLGGRLDKHNMVDHRHSPTYIFYMQIFIKGLRCTESERIAGTQVHIFGRIVTKISTRTEDYMIHHILFIQTPSK